MIDGPEDLETMIEGLLRYQEVLGVIAVSFEGLVMGAAGVSDEDVDMAAALGASLVGVAERTTRRLGGNSPTALTITSDDGMINVLNGGEFALVVFSEPCDAEQIGLVCEPVMRHLQGVLSPV
jgi:predicted regulator of Ras-like GTPase activity (Roadblock/LC7/MglB family)